MDSLPVIDLSRDRDSVALSLGRACRDYGFFYVVNHGIDEALQAQLEKGSRDFFRLSLDEKMKIAMPKGGRAWRGYFPVGNELTSGRPDRKEGLYFGTELGPEHPDVKAGQPLHGANLFPDQVPELRSTVLRYLQAMTELGHRLMGGLSLSLGLPESYFADHYTADPLLLFRIFHYPAAAKESDRASWGVGEHSDYGVLTILKQDDTGGLEVRSKGGWLAAPPLPGSFVCNIGDMLDRMTGGLYRSTPHRVKVSETRDRLSFPFFFDPNFHAEVHPLPRVEKAPIFDDKLERWDKASVHEFSGTYGEYLLGKVSKVFPDLKHRVLK